MSVNFIERGEELIASTSMDRKQIVDAMLDCYLSGEVDYSLHPDQWVRDLQKIDLSGDESTNIATVEYFGDEDTYDLEVDHPDHQFYLPNGILTSNSHAVAYAIDSYMCAWLLTHYEEEWLCAYLETMSNNPDDKAKAFGEIKGMGYQIVPIDINYATKTWTIIPGKKFMPSLLTCKGLGEAAIDEIMENRPYKSMEEFLWNSDGSWRHSKFNKKALESLIKIEAFDSMEVVGPGRLFENYGQMHFVLIESNDLIKKSTKKEPTLGQKNFQELTERSRDMQPWSRQERVQNFVEHLGSVDVTMIVEPDVMKKLVDKGVRSIDTLENGEKDISWFCVQETTAKRTKAGKSYLLIGALGMDGKTHRLSVWGWKDDSKKISPYSLCLAEIEKNDFGCSTTSWKLKTIGDE